MFVCMYIKLKNYFRLPLPCFKERTYEKGDKAFKRCQCCLYYFKIKKKYIFMITWCLHMARKLRR